ncbi:MAG: threonine/serine exporter family protein [Clostridia bacterium]|nr:threonine/serine exporter family protein [Clostridia bacterium]
MEKIISLITAFSGSFGFALLFGLRDKLLLPASIGGLFSWGSYLIFDDIFGSNYIFLSCFLATVIVALYVNIIAYKMKAPTILFLMPAVVPLIPGSDLYYTFLYFYKKQSVDMKLHGIAMLEFAFAIAAGLSVVWAIKAIIKNKAKHEI